MATLSGFIEFARKQRIPVIYCERQSILMIAIEDMPDDDADFALAYELALAIVATFIKQFNSTVYDTAVYNLAFHFLLCYSANQVFDSVKVYYRLNQLRIGIISSVSDSGTSVGYQAIPAYLQNLTPYESDYQLTEWGRKYFNLVSRFASVKSWV